MQSVIIGDDQPAIQQEGRTRDKYEVVTLSKDQFKMPIYRKMESMNPEICDTQHDINEPWVEQFSDIPQHLSVLVLLRELKLVPGIIPVLCLRTMVIF